MKISYSHMKNHYGFQCGFFCSFRPWSALNIRREQSWKFYFVLSWKSRETKICNSAQGRHGDVTTSFGINILFWTGVGAGDSCSASADTQIGSATFHGECARLVGDAQCPNDWVDLQLVDGICKPRPGGGGGGGAANPNPQPSRLVCCTSDVTDDTGFIVSITGGQIPYHLMPM